MKPIRRPAAAVAVAVTATAGLLVGSGILAGAASAATTFIGPLNHERVVASTAPAHGPEAGDVNRGIDRNSGGGGNLFGLAVKPGAGAVYFVDDFSADNNLQLFR